MGVIPPMEPAIALAWSGGGRHARVSRGGRGNQHTVVRVIAGAISHSSHRLIQPLNFGDVLGNVSDGGGGWCGRESHWAGGNPTRVPVLLLLLLLLLLMRLLTLLGFGNAKAAFSLVSEV